jgi:hypothetical protein
LSFLDRGATQPYPETKPLLFSSILLVGFGELKKSKAINELMPLELDPTPNQPRATLQDTDLAKPLMIVVSSVMVRCGGVAVCGAEGGVVLNRQKEDAWKSSVSGRNVPEVDTRSMEVRGNLRPTAVTRRVVHK